MLTRDGCERRKARLWAALPEGVEWVLIGNPRHVNYFSGFWINPVSMSADERALLLLRRAGESALFADNFTAAARVQDPFVDRTVETQWYDHRHAVESRDDALLEAVSELSGTLDPRAAAVEAEWLSLSVVQTLFPQEAPRPQPAGGQRLGRLIEQLRRRKEADELQQLAACMEAGAAGQARALEVIEPGMRELDVYLEVQKASIEAIGRQAVVYGDFRACTPSAPLQGGPPTQRRLEKGDLFVLDLSVGCDGYRSDFSNTISVGHPTTEQQELHGVCLNALAAGEAGLRAGAAARTVHAAVTAALSDAERAHAFPHHAGHGLGLSHPEPPILTSESSDALQRSDVVTLEPGVYVEGIGGIRLEHNYLITDDGFERLSNHRLILRQ